MKASPADLDDTLTPERYRKLAELLHAWTGIKLRDKEQLMRGRLAPRLRKLELDGFGEYVRLLEAQGRSGEEAEHFINALTTNKTSFFREPHHFDYLVQTVFPRVRERALRGQPRRLRLWSAASSTGAEAYTMALLAATHLPASQGWDVKILATDIDTKVLESARTGVVAESELADIPQAMRARFFTRREGKAQLDREVASLVTFARANLTAQPFPVKGAFDAIFCRNVMIYFDVATQKTLVASLCRRLLSDGELIVGHSESLLGHDVERVEGAMGVYRPVHRSTADEGSRQRKSSAHRPVPDLPVKRIILGQWHASAKPMLVSTLLGSCVAAAIYDPIAQVGGLNHFMLPRGLNGDDNPARYGVHAMEVLINELLSLGAERSRLCAKAFGAAEVSRALTSNVAKQNAEFVRRFLVKEGITVTSERMGGKEPREVFLRTDTGEVYVRKVDSKRLHNVERGEVAAWAQPPTPTSEFNPDSALF